MFSISRSVSVMRDAVDERTWREIGRVPGTRMDPVATVTPALGILAAGKPVSERSSRLRVCQHHCCSPKQPRRMWEHLHPVNVGLACFCLYLLLPLLRSMLTPMRDSTKLPSKPDQYNWMPEYPETALYARTALLGLPPQCPAQMAQVHAQRTAAIQRDGSTPDLIRRQSKGL
jgi:hypothetical protein